MITREQVADLRPGDVVEVTSTEWPDGTVVRGPLWLPDGETLVVGTVIVRHWDGRHPFDAALTLTVISRAPRPLYVNHGRAEPAPGDVVRDADSDDPRVWLFDGCESTSRPWYPSNSTTMHSRDDLPERLRLLVDGETGRCVP